MRSVIIFIENKSKYEIEKLLDVITMYKQKNPWCIFYKNTDDPVLYINIDYDNSIKNSLEIMELVKNDQSILEKHELIMIDISGRHNGYDELVEFLEKLFKDTSGYVADDYTDYLWNIKEIIDNKKIDNHYFFDTKGWYEEDKKDI